MSGVETLVRADLRAFAGYRSARSESAAGDVWLNANESPYSNPADPSGVARRYPDPQPAELRAVLARLYGVEPAQLLACRGSDEAIDLLVRALCPPGGGRVLVTSPTFGMYAVCATLHGCTVVDVPLREQGDAWCVDFDAVRRAALDSGANLVFLCSPGNPTGQALPLDAIAELAQALSGHALVVVDEAYGEFSTAPSAATLMPRLDNIAVLRTLSKAHALAAARMGCVLAAPSLIDVLRRCQAPYPVPVPVSTLVLQALQVEAIKETSQRTADVVQQRDYLFERLGAMRCVRRVYRSDANFLLVRFMDAGGALAALADAGVVVRDFRAARGLQDALRISVGTAEQNARVIAALEVLP